MEDIAKMARRTKEDAEQTREAILDSAMQTFYEKGYSRTTFDEIASRINLTKGAVYWHFKNKADVVAALIMRKINQDTEEFGDDIISQTIDELRKKVIDRAHRIEKNKDFQRFLFFMIYRMEWSEAILQNVWAQVGDFCNLPDKKLYNSLLQIQKNGGIKADVDIKFLSEILLSFWNGRINRYISGRKGNESITKDLVDGFDAIMASVKVEKK